MLTGGTRRGAPLVVLVAGLLYFVLPASQAAAVSCEGLQDALDQATVGQTVTVDEGSVCAGTFTLPSHAITLQGGRLDAGFDAGGAGRSLEGVDVGATTIRGLTFMNGLVSGDGGGLSITGDSTPTLDGLSFINNEAEGSRGGGAAIASTSASGLVAVRNTTFGDDTSPEGNEAGEGGGLAISTQGADVEITGSTFRQNRALARGGGLWSLQRFGGDLTLTDNTLLLNDSQGDAGGAYLESQANGEITATLTRNLFAANRAGFGAAHDLGSARGGGLLVEGSGVNPVCCDPALSLSQVDNKVQGNSIAGNSSATDFSFYGGGEFIKQALLSSRGDRFINNRLPVARAGGEAEGAGLWLGSNCSEVGGVLVNAAIAANIGEGETDGVGIHTEGSITPADEFTCGTHPLRLTLWNSTITGNVAPSGTQGLWGRDSDSLTMTNSILAANLGGADLTGFSPRVITYSDACLSTGVPFSGTGNICANPLLEAPPPPSVNQTAASPTLDVGSNAAVPAGLASDYEGDPRIHDSDADGTATVDMGADEYTRRAVSLNASKSKVRKGRKVRLSGQLDAPPTQPGCEANQTVEVQRKTGGGFETFTSTTTDATGSYTVAVKVQKTSVYRTRAPETAACTEGTSSTKRVRAVRP